jgi:hypothetical protein
MARSQDSLGDAQRSLFVDHLASRSAFIRSVMTTPAVDQSELIDPPSPDMLRVTSLLPKPAAASISPDRPSHHAP